MGASGSRIAGDQLSDDELKRLKRRFSRMAGSDGRIALDRIMKEVGEIPYAASILALFDKDYDGFLTEAEVVFAIETLLGSHAAENRLKLLFQIFDKDRDTFISHRDLRAALLETSQNSVTDNELDKIVTVMISKYDADKDGKLSLPEFQNLLRAMNEASLMQGGLATKIAGGGPKSPRRL